MTGSSNTRSTLQVGSRSYDYWSFATLPAEKVARLPFSLKILLENLLRFEDGVNVTQDDIQALLNWEPSTSLQDGLEETYRWIFDEISQSRYAKAA